jgi:hypothetical protein
MRKFLGLLIFALIVLTGCSPSLAGTQVWIDVPVDNLILSIPQTINIEGHASSPQGVAEVRIRVNGGLVEIIDTSATEETLIAFTSSFTATNFGEFVIEVEAAGKDGESSSTDTARVVIVAGTEPYTRTPTPVDDGPTPVVVCPPTPVPGSEGPTPVPIPGCEGPTPVVECGPTPVPGTDGPTPIPGCEGPTPVTPDDPTPVVLVNYWADPESITAGSCFNLFWEAINVQTVVFGGIERDFSGSYHDCICETLTYPLTVTHLDYSTEVFYVTINVSGSCVTPTPLEDTTPPPAPLQLKPLDGADLGCLAYAILRWQMPADESGIGEYRVQVERHSGDNNWQPVSGSTFTGLHDTNLSITVECGYTYRWRVRAIDNEGNIGGWSGWFTFVIPLI